MIVIYAGPRRVAGRGRLASRIGADLAALAPRLVIGSAADGTDLLVLAEACALGVPAQVLLLRGVAEFESDSVADLGPEWVTRYRAALDDAGTTVRVVPGAAGNDGYFAVNAAIIEAATAATAATAEPVTALIVGADRPDLVYTADLATQAREHGWNVLSASPE